MYSLKSNDLCFLVCLIILRFFPSGIKYFSGIQIIHVLILHYNKYVKTVFISEYQYVSVQFLRVFRFLALLWHNNQFYLEVPSPCCVVIALMQKYRLCGDDRRFLSCGCLIYQVRRTVHDHNINVTLYIHILYKHNFLYDYNSFPIIQFFPRH